MYTCAGLLMIVVGGAITSGLYDDDVDAPNWFKSLVILLLMLMGFAIILKAYGVIL